MGSVVMRKRSKQAKGMEHVNPSRSDRQRTKVRPWRKHRNPNKMLALDIFIPVHPGQQVRLVEKLQAIRAANQHTFPGTVARYVMKGDEALTTLHMVFIWKDSETFAETIRQENLRAFQDELTDVLDWTEATYSMKEILIHR